MQWIMRRKIEFGVLLLALLLPGLAWLYDLIASMLATR